MQRSNGRVYPLQLPYQSSHSHPCCIQIPAFVAAAQKAGKPHLAKGGKAPGGKPGNFTLDDLLVYSNVRPAHARAVPCANRGLLDDAGHSIGSHDHSIGSHDMHDKILLPVLCRQEHIPTSLLKLSADNVTRSVQMFGSILSYTGDDKLTEAQRIETVQKLMHQGLKRPELRDELYMQLVKQTRGNTVPESRQRAWELFNLVAASMPPSKVGRGQRIDMEDAGNSVLEGCEGLGGAGGRNGHWRRAGCATITSVGCNLTTADQQCCVTHADAFLLYFAQSSRISLAWCLRL